MSTWTPEQDQLLYDNGYLGAEACARLLYQKTGVLRKTSAVERHAYRIGASLIPYKVCPSCGSRVSKLNYTGVCSACHTKHLLAEQKEFNQELLREIRTKDAEAEDARKDYAAIRKKNNRICRSHGLPGYKDRQEGYGDSANMSFDLSIPRSERQKVSNSQSIAGQAIA